MRKKFTMLFAALLACVGVMKADVTDLPQITEDLENPIYYTIYNTRSTQPGGLMYYAGDAVGLKDGCTSLTLEDKYKFFFTGSHDAMYIHNAATGNKLASVSSWTAEGTEWAMGVSPKGGGLAIGPKGGLNGNSCINEKNYSTDETTSDFTTWSANDEGSIFVVELAENYVFPRTDLFYIIECPLFEKVQGVKKGLYVKEDGTAAWTTVDLTNNNFYWIPTVNEDGTVALKNFGTSTYLSNTNGTMSAEAFNASLKALGDNSFNIILNATLHANGHGGGASTEGGLTNWNGAAGSASAWRFVQKSDPTALQEVVVKYSFTYGGEEKLTQEATTLVGEEWPVITASFPFGVSAAKPEGTVTAEGAVDGVVTKTIELSVSLPFVPAADYASIENWYYLNITATAYCLGYEENQTSISLNQTAVPAESKDAYSWAFIGNPFDGYQIVNKLAGEGKILSSSTATTELKDPADESKGRYDGQNTFPLMTQTPVGEGYNTYWIPTASANRNGVTGFYLAQKDNASNKMNRRDSKLAYWTGGADAGSTFAVVLRDDAAQLQALVDEAKTYLACLNETAVGYVTMSAENKATLSAAIADAETAIANQTGYDAAQVALAEALALPTSTIQPEEGKYYVLHNNQTDKYANVSNEANMSTTATVGISGVFQFVPAENGSFYLKNVERGTYLSKNSEHENKHGYNSVLAGATTFEDAHAVAIVNLGAQNIVSITPVGGATLHHDTNNNKIFSYNAGLGSKSEWVIEEVGIADYAHTVTISDVQWSTLVLGYDAVIPEGVTAYAVTGTNATHATLTEVEGAIPANVAVLLNGAEGSYAFKVAASAEAVEGNLLQGSTVNTNVAAEAYVLAAKNGVGLYKATRNQQENTTFLNNAFKAYLVVEGAAAPMFSLERGEGTTGILNSQFSILNDEVIIYDLAGRRVEKMEKGIYIVNGRKVIR